MARGGGVYSISSRINHVKMIIYCCDPVNGVSVPLDHANLTKYKDWIKTLDIEIREKHRLEQANPDNAVISFTTYMDNVLEKYGEDSMEFLIISLYDENKLRDDYHELKIITSEREIDATVKANYLINPRGQTVQCKIIIQNYKIAKKNGDLQATLSKGLTKLVRKYIETHQLTDKLFPQYFGKGLSSVVSRMSKAQGITERGGVNYLRHAKVSTLLNSMNVTPEERVELSTRMGHSVNIQAEYNRLLKV